MALGPFCNDCDLPHVGNGCFCNGSLAGRAILGRARRKVQESSGGDESISRLELFRCETCQAVRGKVSGVVMAHSPGYRPYCFCFLHSHGGTG